jgi:hypothetical protein
MRQRLPLRDAGQFPASATNREFRPEFSKPNRLAARGGD